MKNHSAESRVSRPVHLHFYHAISFASDVHGRRSAVDWRLPLKCTRKKGKYLRSRSISHCHHAKDTGQISIFFHSEAVTLPPRPRFSCPFAVNLMSILTSVGMVRKSKHPEVSPCQGSQSILKAGFGFELIPICVDDLHRWQHWYWHHQNLPLWNNHNSIFWRSH